MGRRWSTVSSWDSADWFDVVLDEPSVLDLSDPDRDMSTIETWEAAGVRRLLLWEPFLVRCAPGTWQIDMYVEAGEPNVVLEARLHRKERRPRRWNWEKIAGHEQGRTHGRLWGQGDLSGGSFSFLRLDAADAYLREHQVPRGVLHLDASRKPAEDCEGAVPLAVVSLGGAAVTIRQTMGDVPFLVAVAHHGLGDLELAWGMLLQD